MIEHFLLNFNLVKLKRPSLLYSSLLMLITFVELFSTIINKYQVIISQNFNISLSSYQAQFIQILEFLDVHSLTQKSQLILEILYWWFSTQSALIYTLYGICYFLVRYQKKKIIVESFYAKLLAQLLIIDQWITCQPTQLVYLNIFNCPNNKTCLQISVSESAQQIIAGLFLFFRFSFQIIIILFFANHYTVKKDLLAGGSKIILIYFETFRLLLNIFITVQIESQMFHIIFIFYLILTLYVQCILFSFGDFKLCFANQQIRQLFKFCTFTLFGLSLGILSNSIALYTEIIDDDNSLFMSLIFIVFSINIFDQFYANQSIRQLCSNKLTGDLLMQKIFNLKQISKINDINHEYGESDSFYLGMIFSHLQKECPKEKIQRCFCLMRNLFDPKKQKDIKNNQFSMLRQKNLYLKFLIKSWYEDYLFYHPQDNEIRINYAAFLNYQMYNPIQSQLQIQILRKCKLNILQQYDLSKIELQFKHEIIDKNAQSYKKELDFEFVISTEEIIRMIEVHIQSFLDFSLKFWRSVIQKIIYEEDLWNYNQQINITIKKCDKLWKQVLKNKIIIRDQEIQKNFLNKRPRWQFLYNWYHLFVLNKKIKQSMLEYCDSSNIIQQPVEEDSGSDNQNTIDQFTNLKPFNYTSAIFHTAQSGQIINASESAYEMFGFQQLDSINQLIPSIIIRNHQHGIELFVQTGRTKIMYKRKKVLALNSQKFLIPCKKYLKWHISPKSQIEYICMIRPIYRHQSVNYILVNKDWEIDSVSEQLQDFFQIGLCLFLLCPKLLKYSVYSQYLDDDDLKLFKLKRTKNEDNNLDSIVDAKFTNKKITIVPTKYKNEYVKELSNTDLGSVILEDDPKEVEESPIWINDALNEEQQPEDKEQGVRRFHKVVDEDHIKLTFRIPKKIQCLMEDYECTKQSIHKNGLDLVTLKSRMKEHQIVKRNQHGKLIIDKKILFSRLFEFQEYNYQTMYNHYKNSFEQYCMTSRMLKTVIKVEASIRFTKQAIIDKYQIIKITNLTVIESQALDRKPQAVKVFNRQSQLKQRQSVFQHHPSNALQQLIEQNKVQQMEQNYQKLLLLNFYNSEVDSYRNTTNKALLSEDQVILDFNNQKITSLTLTTESNIYIKEENNKPIKKDMQLNFFRIINRIFLVFLIVENIIIAFQGPNMTLSDLDDLGLQSALKQFNFLNIMIESYDKLLTVYYFQNNLLKPKNEAEVFRNLQDNFKKEEQDVQLLLKKESFVKNIFKAQNYGDKNILDLISQYSSNLGNLQTVQQNTDINSEIEFFRKTFVPYLFNHQSNNIYFIVQRVIDGFFNQNQICQTIIIFSSGIFGFYLLYNIINIIKSIQQCQKVSKQLSYIEKNELEDNLRFYVNLKVQFSCICNLNGLISNSKIYKQIDYFTSTNKTVIREFDDVEKNNNLKRQKYKQFHWSKRWKRIKILMIIRYLIFISLITFLSYIYFCYMLNFSLTMQDLLNNNGFLSQTTQLISLTISKEIFIYNYYNNSLIDYNYYSKIQTEYIKNNSKLLSQMYETTLDEIDQLFNEDLCLQLNQQINLNDCQLFQNGALTFGLKQYNYLLSQMAQQLLNPNEGLYENTTVDKLFLFDNGNQFQRVGYLQAWNILGTKFSNNFIEAAKLEIIFLSCTFSFTMLIFILLFEISFFNQMSSIIIEVRNFYKRFFSNQIVDQYKLVRAQLIQCKVIHK